jgi:transcriptional regulator with XRE-family HTH domain
VTVRAYQAYEYGKSEPRMSTLIALADFYDLSLDELVCRKAEHGV